jgi:hypothetical protein
MTLARLAQEGGHILKGLPARLTAAARCSASCWRAGPAAIQPKARKQQARQKERGPCDAEGQRPRRTDECGVSHVSSTRGEGLVHDVRGCHHPCHGRPAGDCPAQPGRTGDDAAHAVRRPRRSVEYAECFAARPSKHRLR